jgi:hypothetical protein
MALFSAPGDAPVVAAAKPSSFPSAVDDEPPLSAFEKRAALRAQRHELVATLRRIDGRSFNEINAWLNRKAGVRTVEAATIAQLEKSIELLLRELDRTKSKSKAPARRAAAR